MEWLTAEIVRTLAAGLLLTVGLTVITSVFSLLLGTVVAGLRLSSRRRYRWPAVTFIEAFRNVPALIQIIFWAFAFPNLFPADVRRSLFFNNFVLDNRLFDWFGTALGLQIPYYALAAGLGLLLNTSAHLAEILRSGIGTIPGQHLDGARTLGAGSVAAFRSVLLPAGYRSSFPAISNRLIHNMKNTSLASFVAVPELFHEIQASITLTFRATEFLLLAAALYLLLAWVMTVALDLVDARLHRGWNGGRSRV